MIKVIDIAKCYNAEVKWHGEHYVPANIEEHIQLSMDSSACMRITNIAFILGDMATTEDMDWVFTNQKIVRAVCIIGRLGTFSRFSFNNDAYLGWAFCDSSKPRRAHVPPTRFVIISAISDNVSRYRSSPLFCPNVRHSRILCAWMTSVFKTSASGTRS